MPQLITETLSDYTNLAVQLAKDQSFYGVVATRLAQMKNDATLFDTERFVQNLENLYLQMWNIFVRGEKKRILSVSE